MTGRVAFSGVRIPEEINVVLQFHRSEPFTGGHHGRMSRFVQVICPEEMIVRETGNVVVCSSGTHGRQVVGCCDDCAWTPGCSLWR